MTTSIINLLVAAAARHPPTLPSARFAVALTFFVNGALFATWVSRIPALQAGRGLSHGVLGLALLAIALGAVVAMPLAGRAATRIGSRRLTQLTAVGMAACLPALMLVPNGPLFVLVLVGFGAIHGALDVAMNTQAVAVEERYRRPINSSFHALFSVGGLVGSGLGGVAAAFGIAPAIHFVLMAVVLGGLAAWLAFPKLLDTGAVATDSRSANSPAAPARSAWREPALLVLGALAFCVMMGEGAMADWSAVFLREVAGATESVAAIGYAAFSITMAVGRFGGGWLSARIGPAALVRWSGLLAVVGIGLVVLHPAPVICLLGFAAAGAGFACVVPLAFTAAGRTPGVAAGVALATVSTIGYLGFLIGPPLIGFAAELLGLRGALGLILVASALIVALAPVLRLASPEARGPVAAPPAAGALVSRSPNPSLVPHAHQP
jgi:predicted MFS family arabinose efflux permease